MTQTGSDMGEQPMHPTNGSTADAPLTRRARREAEASATRPVTRRTVVRRAEAPAATDRAVTTRAASVATGPANASSASRPTATATKAARRRRFMAPVVLALTAGMFGTMAVPAALAATKSDDGSSSTAAAQNQVRSTESQSIDVSGAAALADTTRDGYTATSPKVIQVQTARAKTAASYASYTGPTAEQLAATPTYPDFSLDQVVSVAKQYIGTPYVYGGATPAGFDCSGYIMFVYAQFGISLAHSVPLQDAAGTTIPTSEAKPGDVVIFNNEAHDGFYMGNGMIMDAPKPGGAVSIRPIWTSDYHIVRFGI